MRSDILKIATDSFFHTKRATNQVNMGRGGGGGASYSNINNLNISSFIIVTMKDR